MLHFLQTYEVQIPLARLAEQIESNASIARLMARCRRVQPIETGTETPAVTAQQVRDMLRARRIRADFLPGDLFADPAWDMLLDLLAARLEQERVSVSSLCIAAAVPPTTALRWIRTLTDKGLVQRHADPHDGRRVFISLAQETTESMLRWFGASRRLLSS